MTIDLLTVGASFFSFGVFLLIHAITFRWVAPERLLRSLLLCVLSLMVLPILLVGIFFISKVLEAPFLAWVCAALLASLLQGMLCFFYVLCIFGPYETSVRMRLVREIAAAPSGGILLKDLLQRYNHESIVHIRLQRLIGSGDIIEKNGRYRITNKHNFFFIFDAIASVLKKWINK